MDEVQAAMTFLEMCKVAIGKKGGGGRTGLVGRLTEPWGGQAAGPPLVGLATKTRGRVAVKWRGNGIFMPYRDIGSPLRAGRSP